MPADIPRNGQETLLVEDDDALGGLMTLGELNFIDMCNGRDGTLLTRGTFEEFYNAVGGTAFDIPTAKDVFLLRYIGSAFRMISPRRLIGSTGVGIVISI